MKKLSKRQQVTIFSLILACLVFAIYLLSRESQSLNRDCRRDQNGECLPTYINKGKGFHTR